MRVAIVEDEKEAVEDLKRYFGKFEKNFNREFAIDSFPDALAFLATYRPDYDLVMFDIEMPMLNGMEGAKKLRKIDPYVPIVFVTNMSRYAVEGYSVSAVDFLVKPVEYCDFETMLKRVIRLSAAREDKVISVSSGGVVRQIPVSRIKYVDVYRHKLTFHTIEGNVEAWGSLADVAAELPKDNFSNCTNSYLVNLKYIDYVEKEELVIGGERLPISHLRKKDFMKELARYLGRGGKNV